MLKKSDEELQRQIGQYLAYLARSIPRTRRFSLYKSSLWGHKWPRSKGTRFI